jgi:hypothetical protein
MCRLPRESGPIIIRCREKFTQIYKQHINNIYKKNAGNRLVAGKPKQNRKNIILALDYIVGEIADKKPSTVLEKPYPIARVIAPYNIRPGKPTRTTDIPYKPKKCNISTSSLK